MPEPTVSPVGQSPQGVNASFMPEINISVENLPSKALPYSGAVTIKYRPYMFGEIKKISESQMSVRDTYQVLVSGIDSSIDVYDLTVPDLLYIGFLRKLSTLGDSEYLTLLQCQSCGENNKKQFSLKDIEFDEISAPQLPIKAQLEKAEVKFLPLNVRHFLELVDMGKGEDEVYLLAKQISAIRYDKNSQFADCEFETKVKLIETCTPQDARILRRLDNYLFHGLKPLQFKCSNQQCQEKIEFEPDGRQALILPFRQSSDTTDDAIRFGD